MSRHLGSVSGVRRSRAHRTIARVAIAGQLLMILPSISAASAGPAPASSSFSPSVVAAAAATARAADAKLGALQLPPGALLGDEMPPSSPAPAVPDNALSPSFAFASAPPTTDEEIEGLLADYLIFAEQRPTPGSGALAGPATPAPEPKRVVVNRTVPRVTPRATEPTLSAEPSDREFFDARIFAEPLVPSGPATAEDNRGLGQALRQYLNGGSRENVSIVLAHLQRFPASPWRASLLANVGTVFSDHGYYTRAFQSWDMAWQLSKDSTDPRVRAIADYAVAQWLELMTRFGDVNALEGKMKELDGRKLTGSTGARIKLAREGLWILKNHHEWATPSARTALASWLYVRSPAYAKARARGEMTSEAAAVAERANAAAPLGSSDRQGAGDVPAFRSPKALTDFHARVEGTSLRELANLAAATGLRVRPAYRPAGAPLVMPAIAHLKPGHYAFVLKQEDGRVLLRDSILGGEIWFSRAALEEESSGYWLIDNGPLPNEWRDVQDHEANVVIGRCAPGGAGDNDPGCPCENGGGPGGGPGGPGGPPGGPNGPPGGPGGSPGGNPTPSGGGGGGSGSGRGAGSSGAALSRGMPTYYFHPVTAALRLVDTPVGYRAPRGPSPYFTLSYNHREVMQPTTFTYSNLGPMWTYDWLSYVQEVPTYCSQWGICILQHVSVFLRGSGAEEYRNPDVNGVYPTFFRSRAVLVKVSDSPVRYERRLPNGAMEVFTQPDGAPSGQRRIFLTSIVDPQGQALQITYDAQLRAVAFSDALGQVTTVSYDHPTDPLKITKVTDPFGRFATFTYTPAGQLASITDVLGLTSSFTYASDDFISALTTPYGTTTFRHETTTGYPRMIEATDPLGGTEHLEYHYQNTSIVNAEPAALVPTGFTAFNENLQYYNTFYWNKQQWAFQPGDITKATRTHWLLYDLNLDDGNHGTAGSIPHSIKRPLENTVWYAYPDQSSKRWVGSWIWPVRVGRVLDDGSTAAIESTYNSRGLLLSNVDPLGRRVSYTYASNQIDLHEVRQTTGALNDLLATYGNYNALHQPQTVTDTAGQSMALTYNAYGQILTTVNAKAETTTYVYDSAGYLQAITAPLSTTTTYTYDALGRRRTSTDPDGYTVTTDYDDFNRPTRLTYPDGTYREFVYARLDLVRRRDRQGRWMHMSYDPQRRAIAIRDPLGRVTTRQWCSCDTLDVLIDANGQKTTWQRDIAGRVVKEVRANGTTEWNYTYESSTSRLKSMTDPKLQVRTYTYNIDDTLQSVAYTNATIATPTVSFTYESGYNRMATMVDGTGTTAYTYHPAGTFGAGALASADGPLANDTLTYAYDELGRMLTYAVNGVDTTATFDALSRVTGEVTPVGTFGYTYDGVSSRLATVSYPNGQTSAYVYAANNEDHRLQTIHHKYAGGATLSKFDYTYDDVGNVLAWQQQADANTPTLWTYKYDTANQLVSAVRTSTGTPASVLKRYYYTYDSTGNRTTEQIDDAAVESTYDILNHLLQQHPGGALRFAGSVNEPASVTIQGRPALVGSDNTFSATVPMSAASTVVNVAATDTSGNASTANYQVSAAGATKNYVYDANGNLTSDGVRTFEWDAADRLVAVVDGQLRREFVYDGRYRRSIARTLQSSVLVEERRRIWCGQSVCEERDATNAVLTRYADRGQISSSGSLMRFSDHLDSTRELVDGAGVLQARYDYDPYGAMTVVSGSSSLSLLGYTGLTWEPALGLTLAQHRAYSPALGRWISEDPIGFHGSANFYGYVENNPLAKVDPSGLQSVTCPTCQESQAGSVNSGVKQVCAESKRGNCNLRLRQMNLYDCFEQRCTNQLAVVCMKQNCKSDACGGPCNIVGDHTRYVYLQPNAFLPGSICGPVNNTIAHEMAHMCGVGYDSEDSDQSRMNRRMANVIGNECGGKR